MMEQHIRQKTSRFSALTKNTVQIILSRGRGFVNLSFVINYFVELKARLPQNSKQKRPFAGKAVKGLFCVS